MEDLRQESVERLAARLAALADGREERVLVGLAGPPAAGKSTLAADLAAALGERAAVVGMDGFHLAQAALEGLGRADRKGAPDTFDAGGYAALLTRLRAATGETVWVPVFDRDREEPIANAAPVGPQVDVVITEGNYLLHDADGWERVRLLLDAVWFVDLDEATRTELLTARHVAHGRTPQAAAEWVASTDAPNAELVAEGRERADALVSWR